MSVQIGLCDDRVEDIGILTEALLAYDADFKIASYTDGESLLEDWREQKNLFDILFLDIYMPGLNGIETAGRIRAGMRDVKSIFVSSSSEHYPQAYDVFAFNYILKPLNREKLNNILDQALKNVEKERRQQIIFSYKAKTYSVLCRDILYIESRDKIICFHLESNNMLQCYAKLDEIIKQLPEGSFIRCHQSFVVNAFYVTEMGDRYFCVEKAAISISKKYFKTSKDKYFTYLFNQMNRRGQPNE